MAALAAAQSHEFASIAMSAARRVCRPPRPLLRATMGESDRQLEGAMIGKANVSAGSRCDRHLCGFVAAKRASVARSPEAAVRHLVESTLLGHPAGRIDRPESATRRDKSVPLHHGAGARDWVGLRCLNRIDGHQCVPTTLRLRCLRQPAWRSAPRRFRPMYSGFTLTCNQPRANQQRPAESLPNAK